MSEQTAPAQSASVAEQVGEYYDDIGGLVELVGGNLHVGYWSHDEHDTTFLNALDRLTAIMVERLDVRPGQRILDVGCGVGEPAIHIARRADVTVTGVTMSNWQVQEAQRRIIAAGLRGQVTVRRADAAALPFPDASFERVLAFDALPNAEKKENWLREMFRVLRPGGRCVFSEYPRDTEISRDDLATLQKFTLFDPPLIENAADPAEAVGFEIIDVRDHSDNVRPYYDIVMDRLAAQKDELSEHYGRAKMEEFEAGLDLSYGICKRHLGYAIVTCRRPGE